MQTHRTFSIFSFLCIGNALSLAVSLVHAAYTPTKSDNTWAAGTVAVITTNGLECKLVGDILAAGVTVNSGTLTACSDDELLWTDNGKIKCVALNCPGTGDPKTNKYLTVPGAGTSAQSLVEHIRLREFRSR